MKHIVLNRFFTALAVIAALTFSSCKKDKDPEPIDLTKKATVQLSGAQEVPLNNSLGTGTAQVIFDPTPKTIAYTITWHLGNDAATTTNMHFHGAEDGSDTKSSAVTIGITGFSTSHTGTISGVTRALTDAEVNQLLAGKWYINVHSSTVGSGELRGNIKFN
ncbi:MAG: CHRD domain-containing protein [Sphingobacteriaceae bacterium]|nr:CHRD domain-containing protein [Sphingobacteriaceae bacterium]